MVRQREYNKGKWDSTAVTAVNTGHWQVRNASSVHAHHVHCFKLSSIVQ
jgi:hypothetical protein